MNSNCRPCSIVIKTGSRLHCGLFSDPRPDGFAFQGLGLLIDSPGYQIEASVISPDNTEHQTEHQIIATGDIQKRISRSLNKLSQAFETGSNKLLEVRVHQSLPQHCGFGSGTQLALAVGRLWAWFNRPELTTEQIAKTLNRGQRSCIGTFGFDRGGLLIDRGVRSDDKWGQCRYQTSLPDQWRILLIRPLGVQGISGQNEAIAFEQLPKLTVDQVERLQTLLTIMEEQTHSYKPFCEALREYGIIVGESFASVQSGCFTAPICHEIFNFLSAQGLQGIAQSSWGPTMFGVCESQSQSIQLQKLIQVQFPSVDVRIARPKNTGYQIDQQDFCSPHSGAD